MNRLIDSKFVFESRNKNTEESEEGEGLLPPLPRKHRNKKTLILDLDETLVHSSFQPVPNPHIVLPVYINFILSF
jgi:TFIIF-interacting CTD phosphatase-like protein